MILQVATLQECSWGGGGGRGLYVPDFFFFSLLSLHYLFVTVLLVSSSFSIFLGVITPTSNISILQPNVLITSNLLTWTLQLLLGSYISNCRIRAFNWISFLSYPVYIYHVTRRNPGTVPFYNTCKPCTWKGPWPVVSQQKWYYMKVKTQWASCNAIISELSVKQHNTNH